MTGEPLRMWTIYDRPADFPDFVVLRGWTLLAAGGVPDGWVELFETVEQARVALDGTGMICLGRAETDPSSLVESWI